MEKLKEEINNNMNPETLQENQKRMKALFKKHGVTPFTPLKGLFIQGPVFISFFMAISNMVEKVPSFKGGGAYWFTDLTTPDAMYIFPVLTALTFLATVELNMQEGLEGNPMANTMKKFSRGIGILTIPFTANFPKVMWPSRPLDNIAMEKMSSNYVLDLT
ncbi:mitochondrial inner membrane protein OXA1-like [Phalaenopsis equestris]|uniref:mitochondrial inner membrane protein OXA1-like n=1 Tax=Phalaenopsis equestris TaxID=78828 RepID=UPI0009E26CED|nr:mitochondrial inner membrane protein OXA1-like [Phalaenopsis equestris]